jgi:hypothetical protein
MKLAIAVLAGMVFAAALDWAGLLPITWRTLAP